MSKQENVTMKNRWYLALMSIMVLASLIMLCPLQTYAATTTGTIGRNDGLTWSYDDTSKTLIISGEDEVSYLNKTLDFYAEVKTIIFRDCKLKGFSSGICYDFSQLEEVKFENFDTSEVTSLSYFFNNCSKLTSLDLSCFNTEKATNMTGMFFQCNALKNVNLSSFNTANVTSMKWMFCGCSNLTNLDLSNFNTAKVTTMYSMFDRCKNLQTIDVSSFDTSSVTDMIWMFSNCESLKALPLKHFNTSNVTNMNFMFSNCKSLELLDVSSFDTSQVTVMNAMFYGCSNLTSLDVSSFNTSKVTNMNLMFGSLTNLTNLNLDNFDTSNVKDMGWMFGNCTGLKELDLSSFELSDSTLTENMLFYCKNLQSITTPGKIADGVQIDLPHEFADSKKNRTMVITKDFCNQTLVVPENPFADVKSNSWQYASAQFALDNNLMSGKGKDANGKIKFDPDNTMTRAEFVQSLYNKEGKPGVTFTNKFTDVKSSDWFAKAIIWASDKNIVAGKGAAFDVNGKITRQEIAVILYKYAKYLNYDVTGSADLSPYADDEKIASWAQDAMKWAISKGVMKGKGNGNDISTYKLDPTGNATRAECAAMLKNFITAYE